jgi:hypothetical protein
MAGFEVITEVAAIFNGLAGGCFVEIVAGVLLFRYMRRRQSPRI